MTLSAAQRRKLQEIEHFSAEIEALEQRYKALFLRSMFETLWSLGYLQWENAYMQTYPKLTDAGRAALEEIEE